MITWKDKLFALFILLILAILAFVVVGKAKKK